MKESICKEHLLLTEEIPLIIVVITVDSREEEDMLMRKVDLQRERDTQVETEDLPEEEDYPVMEDPQIDIVEDHLMKEDHLMEEDHLMMSDPLLMEDHLMEMADPQDIHIEEDPQDLEDLPDQ